MAKPPLTGQDLIRAAVLERMLGKPPKPFTRKAKTRPASKRRVHKGKGRT